MAVERKKRLAECLRTALGDLPKSMRPKHSDIAAIALLIAEHPAMGQWEVAREGMDFRDMNPR